MRASPSKKSGKGKKARGTKRPGGGAAAAAASATVADVIASEAGTGVRLFSLRALVSLAKPPAYDPFDPFAESGGDGNELVLNLDLGATLSRSLASEQAFMRCLFASMALEIPAGGDGGGDGGGAATAGAAAADAAADTGEDEEEADCAQCGKGDAPFNCACGLVSYCNAAHQSAHWKAHKTACRAAQAEKRTQAKQAEQAEQAEQAGQAAGEDNDSNTLPPSSPMPSPADLAMERLMAIRIYRMMSVTVIHTQVM